MLIGEILTPVSNLRGVGKTTVEQLLRLNVSTVGDLLRLWPRLWEDRSRYNTLRDWKRFHKLNVPVTVIGHQWFGYGRTKTLKLIVCDSEKTQGTLVCFNRPFLEKNFPEGTEALVYGTFAVKYGVIQSSSFDIEPSDSAERRILPVYPLTQGLTQAKLRKLRRFTPMRGGLILNSLPRYWQNTGCPIKKPYYLQCTIRQLCRKQKMHEKHSSLKNSLFMKQLSVCALLNGAVYCLVPPL